MYESEVDATNSITTASVLGFGFCGPYKSVDHKSAKLRESPLPEVTFAHREQRPNALFSGTALAQPPKKSLRVGEGPRALQEVKNLLCLTGMSTVVHICLTSEITYTDGI